MNWMDWIKQQALSMVGGALTESQQVFISKSVNQNPFVLAGFLATPQGQKALGDFVAAYQAFREPAPIVEQPPQ